MLRSCLTARCAAHRAGRREEETQWEPMSNIRCKEPYVLKVTLHLELKVLFEDFLDL